MVYKNSKIKLKKEAEPMRGIPLDETIEKSLSLQGEIEFCLYTPRNKTGIQTWELKLKTDTGKRKIIVVRDRGFEIIREEVAIRPFKTRAERNAEIVRLYKEQGLSQLFLANLFNISQPSISMIVSGKA